MVDVHLDHRQIRFLIGADHFGLVLHAWRIVLKTHPNAICLFHHVPVGHDVAFGVHDHAGSERTLTDRTVWLSPLPPGPTQEVVKKVIHPPTAFFVVAPLPASTMAALNILYC